MVHYCKNCGAEVNGSYCSQCGQRTKIHKVTFKETFQDFVDAVFSVNAPLFISTKMLLVSPGKMLREYLDGKRKKYYKPVAFFVLTTVVYLLLRTFIGFDPFQDNTVTVQGETGALLDQARQFMLENINKLLFIFTITLALFLKLFFYKRYALAEFLVASFYFIGIYTILATLNLFFIQFINHQLQFLALIFMSIYFLFANVSFIGKPKLWVGIKSALVFLFAFLSYVIVAFGLSYLIVSIRA